MNIWLDWNSYREGKTDSFSKDKGEPSKSYIAALNSGLLGQLLVKTL